MLDLKVPPVALVILTGVLMGFVAWTAPRFSFVLPARPIVAVGIALAGVVVTLLGVASFRRAKTTVNPMKPETSSSLVVSGIYRRTRNPMYLGFLLILLGWAFWLSNALAFIVLPGFVLYMNRFQIGPEERALASRFGPDFIAYKGRVRRWI